MRVLDISDGFTASLAPTVSASSAGQIPSFADDASYIAAQGAAAQGDLYFNTTSGMIRIYDGSVWLNVLTEVGVATLTNKIYNGGTASSTRKLIVPSDTYANLQLLSLTAGQVVYATDTKTFYGYNGTALATIGGGGGGGFINWRSLSNAPSEADSGNLEVLDFDYLSSQENWATVQVPSSYIAGTQILLVGAMFATPATSGKVKFKTTSYLVRPSSTVLGTYSNSRDSTNAEVTVNAGANTVTAVGSLDVTDSTGHINGVAVSPSDLILIKLIRDTASESSSAAADARLIRFCVVPQFT